MEVRFGLKVEDVEKHPRGPRPQSDILATGGDQTGHWSPSGSDYLPRFVPRVGGIEPRDGDDAEAVHFETTHLKLSQRS